jgi:taurine dioxygenase
VQESGKHTHTGRWQPAGRADRRDGWPTRGSGINDLRSERGRHEDVVAGKGSVMAEFDLKPLDHIGVEVVGLNLEKAISTKLAEDLYAAWLVHGVMLFREAGTSSDVHVRLSKVFGDLEVHPIESLRVKNQDNLIHLGGEGRRKGTPLLVDGRLTAGFIFFHQDTTFTPNICKGSMLRMLQQPKEGGDTVWTDTAKAYDALPQHLKERLEGLSSVQCFRPGFTENLWGWSEHSVERAPEAETTALASSLEIPDFPLVSHPFIITHPETGRKSLLMSPLNFMKVEGLDKEEGEALFQEVASHALRSEFSYRHKWSVNDLVLWDNRRTMHAAMGYPYEHTRLVHRTTLLGGMRTGRYYEGAEPVPA